MSPKLFSLGAILSIVDGHLVAPNKMDDVYAIMDYLTGDKLSTIGLLAAKEPCKAALLEQHPQLADVAGTCTTETWRAWIAAQVERFGAELPVLPMAKWEKRSIADDILDINRLAPNAEILVVEP